MVSLSLTPRLMVLVNLSRERENTMRNLLPVPVTDVLESFTSFCLLSASYRWCLKSTLAYI